MSAKGDEADFVIVGGGAAGCVLAARLSEDADATVRLLEAGPPDRHPLIHMPAGFAKMTKGILSWGWSTVPQRHLGGRVLRFTQGKVLGGGSSINAQIYTRGHPSDYDRWAAAGCTGWSFREILPYFVRSEDNERWVGPYHGYGGPLGVSNPIAPLPIAEAYFQAAQELGLPFNPDLNGPRQEGVGYYQLTQRRSRRSSTAQAFLRPARGRRNLAIDCGLLATRLVIERGRVVGVEVGPTGGGPTRLIRARREVIVAAGAFGSPALLLRSGVGPADHLRALGVAVAHDLPGVGANVQDHLDLFAISECTGPHSYDGYARIDRTVAAGAQYLLTGKGPAASSLFETGGFWWSRPEVRAAGESPDIQLHLGLGSGIEAGVARMRNAGVTLNSAYLRPASRGTLRLASADPAAAPLIDPNYWAEPEDRARALDGLRLARAILAAPALRRYVAREVLPGPDARDDAALIAYAMANAKTDHHPVGACGMGPDGDPMAVLTPDLRLRGLEGVRVADSSAMPLLPSCNTNAPTIMLAEKAADLIRGRAAPPPAVLDAPR